VGLSGAVLLAGATGLVGGEVTARLLALPGGPRILAPTRRPLPVSHPRLFALPAAPDAAAVAAAADGPLSAYVCCLGTTIKRAGSREAFLAVDRDLVLAFGEVARACAARHAVLVSSVGASAQSNNFYLRVKGEAERGLAAQGFERVDCLRPGLLLGDRAESRPAEAFGRWLAPALNPLLRGPLRRYRAIAAADVAAAAVALLGAGGQGRFEHDTPALVALARDR